MNYKIENNINFFAELKNELEKNISNNSDLSNNFNDICLITHRPLESNYITLSCHHKFNYLPLYNEVVIQKKNYNYLEITHLFTFQIKCPYCRTITNKLLPYIKHPDVSYIRGVNYPVKYCMSLYNCQWVLKSGKKKNNICDREAHETEFGIYCHKHQKLCKQKQNSKIDISNQIIWTEKHEKLNKKYCVVQLKEILRENKMKVSGVKKLLINRIIIGDLV